VADSFVPALGLERRQLLHAATGARARLSNLVRALGMNIAPGTATR
jgi:hypothetical protein